MSDKFSINKGSDLEFSFNWPNGVGGNANLNGYRVSLYDLDPALVGHISTNLVDPFTGLITTKIEWNTTFKLGRAMGFRFAIQLGELDQSTNLISVEYS